MGQCNKWWIAEDHLGSWMEILEGELLTLLWEICFSLQVGNSQLLTRCCIGSQIRICLSYESCPLRWILFDSECSTVCQAKKPWAVPLSTNTYVKWDRFTSLQISKSIHHKIHSILYQKKYVPVIFPAHSMSKWFQTWLNSPIHDLAIIWIQTLKCHWSLPAPHSCCPVLVPCLTTVHFWSL